jgi:hypothetical protein
MIGAAMPGRDLLRFHFFNGLAANPLIFLSGLFIDSFLCEGRQN